MLNRKLWGLLGLIAAILAVPLYLSIDSKWALENNLTVPATIAFFAAAAGAIFFALNAVGPTDPDEKAHDLKP